MPIQETFEGSPSENETKAESQSDTSESGPLATGKPNTSDTLQPTTSDMTKTEALAVAWTGIEALALMAQANLYHSRKTGRVVIELLSVRYDPQEGIVVIE